MNVFHAVMDGDTARIQFIGDAVPAGCAGNEHLEEIAHAAGADTYSQLNQKFNLQAEHLLVQKCSME